MDATTKCVTEKAIGRVTGVRGSVVDVAFLAGKLLMVCKVLLICWNRSGEKMAKVQGDIDDCTVRAVAMLAASGPAYQISFEANGSVVAGRPRRSPKPFWKFRSCRRQQEGGHGFVSVQRFWR